MTHAWIGHAALLLLGFALFAAALALLRVRPLSRPELGERGLERARLVATTGAAPIERAVRFVGALFARLPIAGARGRIDRALERAGQPFGLCADEYLALSALLAAAAAVAALAVGLPLPPAAAAVAVAIGAPALRLGERARRRERLIARRLPEAIDLMALCMGAGLDFLSALRLAAEELGGPRDPLQRELRRVLRELAMGVPRREALRALAARVPAAPVRDFTNAVIQAEQKGSPLSDVLDIQARVLRRKRSIAAEEAAARASVWLTLPLLLLLCCIVLLLFGPFLAGGAGL